MNGQAKLFISYSRRDGAIAERLREELQAARFDAYLDRHDIAPGEPWRERLGALIDAADSVIFLISPDAVTSEICDWEVNRAERHGKRIFPVVARATADARIPERLRRLNFVFLSDNDKYDQELRRLVSAIRTDLDWVREHTRLSELADSWDRADRPARLLLGRRDLIESAEGWRDKHPPSAPSPSALQLAFIAQSRRGAAMRQRRLAVVTAMVAVVMTVLAGVAILQKQVADTQRARAQTNEQLASSNALRAARQAEVAAAARDDAIRSEEQARASAVEATASAEHARRETRIATLQREAARALAEREDSPVQALKRVLAAASEHAESDLPDILDLHVSLFETLQAARLAPPLRAFRKGLYGTTVQLALEPDVNDDQRRLLVVTRDMALLAGLDGRPQAWPIVGDDQRHLLGNAGIWLKPGKGFALATGAHYLGRRQNIGVSLFNDDGTLRARLLTDHPEPILSLAFMGREDLLLAGDEGGHLVVIDPGSLAVRVVGSGQPRPINGLHIGDNGTLVIGFGPRRHPATFLPEPSAPAPSWTVEAGRRVLGGVGLSSIVRVQPLGAGTQQGVLCVHPISVGEWSGGMLTCDAAGGATLWDWDYDNERYEAELRPPGPSGPVLSVASDTRRDLIALGGADGSIHVTSARGQVMTAALARPGQGVLALAFTAGGAGLLGGGSGSPAIERWHTGDLGGSDASVTLPRGLVRFAVSADGRSSAFAFGRRDDSRVTLVDADGRRRHTFVVSSPWKHELTPLPLAVSGATVAWAEERILKVADANQPRREWQLSWPEGLRPVAIALSSDGRTVAAISTENSGLMTRLVNQAKGTPRTVPDAVLFWDLETESAAKRIPLAPNIDLSALVALPRDAGPAFVTADLSGRLTSWYATGEKAVVHGPVHTMAGAPLAAIGLTASPDGTSVMAALVPPEAARLHAQSAGVMASLGLSRGTHLGVWPVDRALPASESDGLLELPESVVGLSIDRETRFAAVATVDASPVDAAGRARAHTVLRLLTMDGLRSVAVVPSGTEAQDFLGLDFDADGSVLLYQRGSRSVRRWPLRRSDLIEQARRRVVPWQDQLRVQQLEQQASAAREGGENDKALGLLRNALEVLPEADHLFLQIGHLEGSTGPTETRRHRALAAFDQAVRAAPHDVLTRFNRGKTRFLSSDFAGAVEDLQAIDPVPNMYLRAPLVIADFVELNVQHAEIAWKLAQQGKLESRAFLSYAHFYLEQWAETGELLDALIADGLDTPQHREYRAHALHGRGQLPAAVVDLLAAANELSESTTDYGAYSPYKRLYSEPAARQAKIGELLGLAVRWQPDAEPSIALAERAIEHLRNAMSTSAEARKRLVRPLAESTRLLQRRLGNAPPADAIIGDWLLDTGEPMLDVRADGNGDYRVIARYPHSNTTAPGELTAEFRFLGQSTTWPYQGRHTWGGSLHGTTTWSADGAFVALMLDTETLWYAYVDSRYQDGWLLKRATPVAGGKDNF